MLDGKELAFWGSPSDQPHSWYEELWASVEAKVMQGLLGPNRQGMSHGDATPTNWQVRVSRVPRQCKSDVCLRFKR